MLIDGVDLCGLLGRIYQLFGLILTAPIHWRGSIGEQVMYCNATFLQICSDEQTNLSTSLMTGVIFQKILFLSKLFL